MKAEPAEFLGLSYPLPTLKCLFFSPFLPILGGIRAANCQQHWPEHTFPAQPCPGTGISSVPAHKAAAHQRKEPRWFHSGKEKWENNWWGWFNTVWQQEKLPWCREGVVCPQCHHSSMKTSVLLPLPPLMALQRAEKGKTQVLAK